MDPGYPEEEDNVRVDQTGGQRGVAVLEAWVGFLEQSRAREVWCVLGSLIRLEKSHGRRQSEDGVRGQYIQVLQRRDSGRIRVSFQKRRDESRDKTNITTSDLIHHIRIRVFKADNSKQVGN